MTPSISPPPLGATCLAFFIFTFLIIHPAIAAPLNKDCEPDGIIEKAKEIYNPSAFWSRKIQEIKKYAESKKIEHQLFLIDQKRSKINQLLNEEEWKAMGIPQRTTPEMEKSLKDGDDFITNLERKIVDDAISWSEKCTIYAKNMLSK